MDSSIQPPPTAPLSGLETKGDSNGTGNVSDEEGFLSGEEEFQVASESPVAPISDHPFSVSADEMFKAAAEGVDVKEENEAGKKMLEEDGLGKLKELSNDHLDDDSGSAASYTSELKVDKGGGAEGVGDIAVKLEDAQGTLGGDNGEKLNRNAEKMVEVGDGVVLVNEKSDNVVLTELSADDTDDGKQVAQVKRDGVPIVPNENFVESNKEELKLAETDAIKAGGRRITSEGDSVVDAIDADVKVPGVAVVWNEPAKEEELAVDAATGNVDERNEGESKAAQSDVADVDGVRLTPEGDSVVDTVGAAGKIPGVVVVEKTTELQPAKKEEFHVDAPLVTTDLVDERNQRGSKADESDSGDVAELRLTSEGDSVVDTIDADLNVRGVVVVKTAKSEPAELEEEPPVGTTSEPAEVEEERPVGITSEPSEVKEEPPVCTTSAPAEAEAEVPVGTTSEPVEVEEALLPGDSAALANRNGLVSDVVDVLASKTDGADDACVKPAGDSNELQRLDTNQYVLLDDAVETLEAERGFKNAITEGADLDVSVSDDETDGLIFGSSQAAKQSIEQLEQGSGGEVSHDHLQRMDGQVVTDSDEEVDTDDEEGKELLEPSALAALLKAATGADVGGGGGGITITSQDGTRLFSVERPAGLGSSLRALRPNTRQTPLNMFAPATNTDSADSEVALSDEEKKTLEKLQQVRVKYLRLVHRLGLSPDDSVPAQVLYRMMLILGRQGGRAYTVDAAKVTALQLEAEEANDMDLSLNMLVLGKCGVGKSATINSIFGEEKARINAFQPSTGGVQEIVGYVNGVKLRVFDTPGLRCSVYEQSFNRNILSSVKRATKKHPLDIVLYVDRLDSQTRDMNDVPMLKTITSSLGSSIWKMAIITLTHAATAPPDGPTGSPLSYDQFASQRSHVLQQTVSVAAGEIRMLNPSLMHPVALVENHASCRKNREGQKVLPNGQSWRPQLLLLCYSLKILAEVNSISKPQDAFDHRKIFGLRGRSPPLPYMLSSMLQSRAHPKLPNEQGGDNGDSDIDLDYFSDSDQEEEDEYDQLPPFKPLRKAQLAKLSKDQWRAYFEEYDYRVKLLQKKQLREELKRMKEMKNKGKDATIDYGYMEEDGDSGAAAPVAVPLPDMVLPPSFDSDNPAYRYRFLEPTSQFLARPVLDAHGWDHDCGYDGVNVEQGLAIVNRFPAAVTFQITKDKKDFTVNLDSSVSVKHGENGSSMAGLDIQSLGKQLAYTVRGETKFKNLKKNKTSGGISITFLGDNIVSGAKLEDQITLGKQYVLVGSAGAVRSDRDTAYGANFELQRREADFPIGQAQSTFSMSLIKWRGDLALGVNSVFQFSVGRGSKVAIRAGLNNKLSGQISVKTSSSEHLSLALTAFIPTAIAIYKKLFSGAPEQYAMY